METKWRMNLKMRKPDSKERESGEREERAGECVEQQEKSLGEEVSLGLREPDERCVPSYVRECCLVPCRTEERTRREQCDRRRRWTGEAWAVHITRLV